MKTPSKLHRVLQATLIAGITVFALAPAHAADAPKVTANNYVRAETDVQMKGYIESYKCFGKFSHFRKPYDVDNQVTVSGNRDTLYSVGAFDLRSPVTVTLPDTKGRYQSLMIVSQDHSIWGLYGPKTGTLTEEKVGTRYVFLALRTFADPNDEEDMKAAHQLQDAVSVKQADIGKLEVPDWNKEEVEQMRDTIRVVASTVTDLSKMFGKKEELDPVYWMLGAAIGWGGLPAEAASYVNVVPEKNDGKTAYTLTAKDVPVDAFWSVTLYDEEGWMPVNKYNAYSFNDVTAKKDKDGSITIHFGGDPKADNFLPIVPGWNYIVRQYKPRKEILDGSWTFPQPVASAPDATSAPPPEAVAPREMTCAEVGEALRDEEREEEASYLVVWAYGVRTGVKDLDFEKYPVTKAGLEDFVTRVTLNCEADPDKRFVDAILE